MHSDFLGPEISVYLKKGVFIVGNFRYIQSRAEEYNEPQVPNTRLPSDQPFVFTLAPSVRLL